MKALLTHPATVKLVLRPALAALVAALGLVSRPAWAQDASADPRSPNDPARSGSPYAAQQRTGPTRTQADRARLVQTIEEQLAAMPCKDRTKRGPDDHFVVSMVEARGQRASVDYRAIQGLKETAGAVADFLVGASADAVRDWQALARVKGEKAAQKQIDLAKAQSIEGRLERFSLAARGRKAPDDVFVVGTAELRLTDRHADVRFQAMRGTGDVAGFLVAYIVDAPDKTQRLWHVFLRVKTEDEAEQYLAALRLQYDATATYRSSIASIYQARTTRRC